MNKQSSHSLGFCDWSWNPVRGLCPESPEYARRIYARFHYDPKIRLDEKELMAPYKLKKPARIFCGSTIEMFYQDIHGDWLQQIVKVIKDNPQHVFQFLYHFSHHRGFFPKNCWLGLTVTSYRDANKAVKFANTYPDHIKFISFEPLLGDPTIPNEVFERISWIIIGAETGNRKGKLPPRTQWIEKLLDTADKYRLPVYMKDSLDEYRRPLKLRQEFPKTK
jgi:protein gp37